METGEIKEIKHSLTVEQFALFEHSVAMETVFFCKAKQIDIGFV